MCFVLNRGFQSLGIGWIPTGLLPTTLAHRWGKILLWNTSGVTLGELPPRMNDTLIMLIPKNENSETIRQFRPISLCNVAYKTITKVLINHLKPLLDKFISLTQSSFVSGRLISNNILIYQEVLHTFKKKTGANGSMMIKLDLEKAYDKLSWSFIWDTLHHFGLPPNWIMLIMNYITSASF